MGSRSSLPQFATASDLELWADRLDARALLPELVRRIVKRENDQVTHAAFRAGDGVGLPDYDGTVRASRGTPFVPDGFSVWEMGVSRDPRKKANADYLARTKDPRGIDPGDTTFVFVTPRRWDDKRQWAATKRREGKWRDVVVLDGDDIEQALEDCPTVHYWISERIGKPVHGATTAEQWWDNYTRQSDPTLTPGMVLAGRESVAAQLLRLLLEDARHTIVRAPTVDDGLAFVAATVMAASTEDRETLLARALVVHDGPTLRTLDAGPASLLLLPYEEELSREARLLHNHNMVLIVTDRGGAHVELPPIPHEPFTRELLNSGVSNSTAQHLARLANKSLVAFQRGADRYLPRQAGPWTEQLEDFITRRLWLAGSWSSQQSGDVEIIEQLTESAYREIRNRARQLASQPDPIFSVVGDTFKVLSPADSWQVAHLYIDDDDMNEFERSVQIVLSSIDPALQLPLEDRWLAGIQGKTRIHSNSLRRGLATTLALLGSRGEGLRLGRGRTAKVRAEAICVRLFDRANRDSTGELWASLSDVLPLLAEAAPDPFLRAFMESLSGTRPIARTFFTDETDGLNISSPHTSALWALETLARSPTYFSYAIEALAEFAEIDPGGRLSNRPTRSLEQALRPWATQTTATLDSRLSAIDALVARHPKVAFDVLLSSIPTPGAIGLTSHQPEFRDWEPTENSEISSEEIQTFNRFAVERLIELASVDIDRWSRLIDLSDDVETELRELILGSLDRIDRDELTEEDQAEVFRKIDSLVRRHTIHNEQAWALPEEDLRRISEIGLKFAPTSALKKAKWIFDDWHPDLPGSSVTDFEEYERRLGELRGEAVREILIEEGLSSVQELAISVELPWAVGSALAAADSEMHTEVMDLLDSEEPKLLSYAGNYLNALHISRDLALSLLRQYPGSERVQARILLSLHDLELQWELLQSATPGVVDVYWREFRVHGRGSDFSRIAEVAKRLLDHGRVSAALDGLSMYADRYGHSYPTELIVAVLRQFGSTEDPDARLVSTWDIDRLLALLRTREIDEDTVAMLEFRFLPARRGTDDPVPVLEAQLARDPEFYVEVVSAVYRARNAQEAETGESHADSATNAWHLLRSWRHVPGSRERGGSVDGGRLNEWVEMARGLLAEADRLEVGEEHIGQVLTHGPVAEDEAYPVKAIRDLIEKARSSRIENGFVIGELNKRGVTSRGLTEGGAQEYRLAERYNRWATIVEVESPRTAGVLRQVAESYEAQGRWNDESAARFLEGFDQ